MTEDTLPHPRLPPVGYNSGMETQIHAGWPRVFHQFFPPPKFLEMPAVGLDISESAVCALELIRRRGAFAVGRAGRRPLPPGVIVGGQVTDADAVVGALRALKEELRLDFVNASLSEEKAYLFETRIPRLSRKEIRGALQFKLEENVPIPAADAVFDYTVIERAGHEAAEHLEVSVTVLPRATVETYTNILARAALVPLSFEIEAQAIARAVIAQGDWEAHLVVNLGETKAGLFIVSNEVVHFTSTITLGGDAVAWKMEKRLSRDRAEAARLKEAQTAAAGQRGAPVFPSFSGALSALETEVNKLSLYWQTHPVSGGETKKPFASVIFTGRGSALPGFDDSLSLALGIPVAVGNVWRNAFSLDEYIPPIRFADSLDYAAAVGLALPKLH